MRQTDGRPYRETHEDQVGLPFQPVQAYWCYHHDEEILCRAGQQNGSFLWSKLSSNIPMSSVRIRKLLFLENEPRGGEFQVPVEK